MTHACKFCGKEYVSGPKLGGHTAGCSNNPKSAETCAHRIACQTGRPLSHERKEKLSNTIKKKLELGTWHNSFARSRKHTYKGESFDGTWELKLAQWFDSQKILWIRNKACFPYVFLGEKKRYTPDFYLPDIDVYVEVKGWKTSKDEAKWAAFPRTLIVLSGTDLQKLGLDISVRKDWK